VNSWISLFFAVLFHNASIDPQAAHATIWKNIEAQVGHYPSVQNLVGKKVARVRLKFCARQHTLPRH
jgi:hypothetical protein